jgi:hypothetical protein
LKIKPIQRILDQDLADARILSITNPPRFSFNGKPLVTFGHIAGREC